MCAHCADVLRRHGYRLVVAESCTGGWLAKVLTDLPGSSDWFDRGFVTYSNQAKQTMLGVS
ncbi:MAG: nicotinamide-nucleotide amidohydrolase family protein, partial [Candidatus Thiodiazotropha sp.]